MSLTLDEISAKLAEFYRNDQFREMVALQENTAELMRVEMGDRSAKYVAALNDLGGTHRLVGEYDHSEESFVKAADIESTFRGKDNPNYTTTLWTFSIMAPAIFVPTLATFYWKRVTSTGALASSILGAATSGLCSWLVLPKLSINMQSILEPAFIGVLISLIALVVGSYLSHAPSEEKWQLFMAKKDEITVIEV